MFNAKQQPTDNAIEKYYWCQMTSKKNPIQMKMLLQEIPQQVNCAKTGKKSGTQENGRESERDRSM